MIDFDGGIKALQEIIKFRSVEGEAESGAPFGKEVKACLDYSLRMMKEAGFSVKNLEGYCGWGEIGSGELFGVLCHLDVVPEGDGWSHDPYGGEIALGKLFGRGTLDDKGPFIACFYAAKALLEEGYTPKKRLRFILGCDEESGWKCMDRYFETEEVPAMGFSPDADFPVINCEKGIVYHTLTLPLPEGISEIAGGLRANMVPADASARLAFDKELAAEARSRGIDVYSDGNIMTLKAKGISAHGSHPEKGDNALIKLLSVLGKKYPELKSFAFSLSDYSGKNINLALKDEKSGELTLNLGTARTEEKTLICELDVRYPVSYNRDIITEELKKGLLAEVAQGFYHDPLYVDKEHPLVKTLLKAYDDEVKGDTPSEPISIGGGTYARALPVGVAFGPCFPFSTSTIHEKDEHISIEEFKLMTRVYYNALKMLCF